MDVMLFNDFFTSKHLTIVLVMGQNTVGGFAGDLRRHRFGDLGPPEKKRRDGKNLNSRVHSSPVGHDLAVQSMGAKGPTVKTALHIAVR